MSQVLQRFGNNMAAFADWLYPRVQRTPEIIYNGPLSTVVVGSGGSYQTGASITIPGNTLGTNNILRITYIADRTTGTGTWGHQLGYGGSGVATTAAVSMASCVWEAYVAANAATNAQYQWCTRHAATGAVASSSIDSTADQTLLIEVSPATGTSITSRWLTVELLRYRG